MGKRGITQPRFSWSLLAAIPRRRLVSIAAKLGERDIDRDESRVQIAKYLLVGDGCFRPAGGQHRRRVEKSVLEILTVPELRRLRGCLGLPPARQRRADLIRDLLHKPPERPNPAKYPNRPSELDDDPDLRAWAANYMRAAEADGKAIRFSKECDGFDTDPVGNTIRFVSDLWGYLEWPEWLTWQRYGGPVGRGPWWTAGISESSSSWRWSSASIAIKGPFGFPFDRILIANDELPVTFTLQKAGEPQPKQSDYRSVALAVQEGMADHYEEDEFDLFCRREPNSLEVTICLRDFVQWEEQCRKDRHGIWWFGPQSADPCVRRKRATR